MGEQPSRLRFGDWSAANPLSEHLNDAMWTARYDLKNLTQTQAYLILEAAEGYLHLASHQASTKNIIAQLRKIRARVRELK